MIQGIIQSHIWYECVSTQEPIRTKIGTIREAINRFKSKVEISLANMISLTPGTYIYIYRPKLPQHIATKR